MSQVKWLIPSCLAPCCLLGLLSAVTCAADAIVRSEFIYEQAPFPSCHASTIVETPQGLIVSWFGGLEEGDPSVGIWVSRQTTAGWTPPVEVATGEQTEGTTTKRYPCWNPVLYQFPDGPVALYYKVGPNPRQWWGMEIRSTDGGLTWSPPTRLPEGILGPIKNKPIRLASGTLLSGSSTEDAGWRAHFEWSTDGGQTWQKTAPINNAADYGLIQPTMFVTRAGAVVAYFRSRQGKIAQSQSTDQGRTWSAIALTELPNPNSGIDGVTLADGRHALIYNHVPRGRSPLNLALAADDSFDWQTPLAVETEPGEYSYPAIIQTGDGLLHLTYTWKRQRVKHVVVDPNKM